MTDLENGEKLLHDELAQFIEKNKLSAPEKLERDRLVLRTLQYMLSSQASNKTVVDRLKKKSIGIWIDEHQQATWGLIVLFIIVQKSLSPILIAFGVPKEIALLIGS